MTKSGSLPNIHIIGTGGTIAGKGKSQTAKAYTSGKVGVDDLLANVPEIAEVAHITGEQIFSIGSQDMNDDCWLKLARRCNEVLASPDIDGIVLIHGTDTMAETAFFLNLTVHSEKPLILVGAMRPSTAKSADGPLNLYNAVVAASQADSRGRGVMVAMNDIVFGARDVIKTHTTAVDTFGAPNYGPLGRVCYGGTIYQRRPESRHTTRSEFNVDKLESLPKVAVVYGHANASPVPVRALTAANYAGIVNAGAGNGNIYCEVLDALCEAREQGVFVVRSSCCAAGPTERVGEVDDEKYGFVASGMLVPQKARILLMLALTVTQDLEEIRRIFQEY